MILPDVNVLVYAHRSGMPHHKESRAWLDHVIETEMRFALSPVVLSAVVRIVTNPRSFAQPSTLDEAFGFCRDLMEQPTAHRIQPSERHWSIFERLCLETETRGSRVSDVWHAALAIDWGCEWITYDRDFARFPGLNWSRPGDHVSKRKSRS